MTLLIWFVMVGFSFAFMYLADKAASPHVATRYSVASSVWSAAALLLAALAD